MTRNERMDLIYESVEHLMRDGLMRKIDALLQGVLARIGRRDTDDILAYLTATLPVKSRLPSRVKLLDAAARVFMDRGEDADALLKGL